MTDIDDLRSLKDRQQVMMAELQHRTRNLLAVVQSIANQTLRNSDTVDAFADEFAGRLRALSRVQGLLASTNHAEIELRELVMAELEAHADDTLATDRIVVQGPHVVLPANSAQAISLALHELATNAVKYGALAQPGAQLTVNWQREEQPEKPVIRLEWRETGVTMPPASAVQRKGYGTELIVRALPYQLRARTQLEFGESGVSCTIEVPDRRAADTIPNG